ncbi:MAG: glycosyltransferase family 4 protein [Candidatus Diapherotrites archaeon]
MRIGFLVRTLKQDSFGGGIARYYETLINALKKEIEVNVFCCDDIENNNRIFFHRIDGAKGSFWPLSCITTNLAFAKNFYDKSKKIGCDLIEAPLSSLDAYYIAKEGKIPVMTDVVSPASKQLKGAFSVFGIDSMFLDRTLVFNAEKSLLKNSAKIIANSKFTLNELIKNYYGRKENCLLVRQSIETSKFKPIKTKEKMFFKQNKKRLLYVGRIEPKKGLKVLLEALKQLNESIELSVAGGRLNKELPYHKKIIESIKENKKHSINFLGFIKEKDLIHAYNEADLIVVPSFSESACYVLLEGMSCGKPVIASRVEGMAEIAPLELHFTAGNSDELAEKISFLIDNKILCRALGRKSRRRIVKYHSIAKNSRKFLALYKSLVQ